MVLSVALSNKLTAAGVGVGTPGWTIVQNTNLLPTIPGSAALFGDTDSQALRKLMNSYYNYGRSFWTWAPNAGGAAANGGLVKGNINAVACASFNLNFKFLAETGMGIQGITSNQEHSNFLTVPGAACIDSKWPGNVRSAKETFTDMKCYKFSGHYWVCHGGINYDVCYNNNFANVDDIIWTKLLPTTNPKLAGVAGLGAQQILKLEKPLPLGDHLIQIQVMGPNGWPSYQLVSEQELLKL